MLADPVKRGRPRVHDSVALGREALALLARDGYSAVSVARLAAELGVSVRTLHRFFSSKAHIVWGPVDQSFTALQAGIGSVDPALPLIEALVDVTTSVLQAGAEIDDAATSRTRLRLIAATPELRAYTSEPFEVWRERLIGFVAMRLRLDPNDLLPIAIGSAVQAAVLEALLWWGTHDESEPPQDAVSRALRSLRDTFSSDI